MAVHSDNERSPLDDPLNSTYLLVLVVEIVIVFLLFVVGRMAS